MTIKTLKALQEAYLREHLREVDVPDDLSTVLDVDAQNEVEPHEADLSEEAVLAIWNAFQDLHQSGVYPMSSLCLRRRGKIVLNRSLGYLDDKRVGKVSDPVCLFSASKAVTAILMHLLDEQGHIELTKPVSHYIPAFAAGGKQGVTVLQMLSHRGGIPTVPDGVDPDLLFDHDAALALICEAEPASNLGKGPAYHAITSGFVFNELIKVTTGLNAQQYLDRYIRKPMGMRYFRYGLTKRDRARVALNVSTGLDNALINKALGKALGAEPDEIVELTNDTRFYESIIPSVNLFATAEETSRFFQMLLNRGSWNGKQIVTPATVAAATGAFGRMALDRTLFLPMRYSAGFMLGAKPGGIFGLDTEHAFGHLGFANILCWADPQRDIAVSIMNTGKLVLGAHLKTLPLMVHTLSSQCDTARDRLTASSVPGG